MPETEQVNASITILVVDDNEANRMLAQQTLEDEGYRVTLARSGAEALATFEAEPPDCVVLDVRMPEMDGFAVCERIRALPHGPETPVIFLTALRDIDTFDRALDVGGDDFLTKPVRPAELIVRVQSMLKLRRLRNELHDYYELMKRQRDDLMRLQLQKERLTAFLVHDLKNPVNVMDLHAQLLLRDKQLSDTSRDSAARIRNAARGLTRMIMNLLDLSKGDEGKLVAKRTEVDLAALLREIFADVAMDAEARSLRLESDLEVERIHADEDLFRRLLINLIENAIVHAPAKSVVTVTSRRHDGAIELRVRDTGAGVPAEMRESVFEAFAQVAPGSRRKNRGLGLAFCKLAAIAHDGRIWVEDASPGAAFCVRLPDGP
jgi:signal transduction histidine kinase